MKRLLALVLCLCFALAGCGAAELPQGAQEGGSTPAASPAPVPSPAPVAAADYEKLALSLAALPELPAEPDERALWEQMNDKSAEEQEKLWNEFSAQQDAYYDAVRALRGDGVDAALTPAFTQYTLRVAQQLMAGETEKNVVWSPVNLYLALCMLAETTDGASRAQLLELLGLADVGQARSAANALYRSLYNDNAAGRTLLANSLWLNEQFDYRQETVDTLSKEYFASAFRAPMGTGATDDAIHKWINENTNGLLADAANGLSTDPDTLLMLISTLYFKGSWSDRFDEYATSEDVFTTARGEEQRIDFMHKTESGTYYRGEGFTIASLPFRDGTAMWFLLPDEGVSPDEVWSLVRNLPTIAVATSSGCYETFDPAALAETGFADIRWSVPKFDVTSDLDLVSALRALGVNDVFEADAADFTPLTGLDAAVSAIEHAARVKVDEEGCEAAAFTAIAVKATGMLAEPLPVVEMDLNRPFGFLITGADGLPLFLSTVNTVK